MSENLEDAIKEMESAARELVSWDWSYLLPIDHPDVDRVEDDVSRLKTAIERIDKLSSVTPRWTPGSLAEDISRCVFAFSDRGRKDMVRDWADAVERLTTISDRIYVTLARGHIPTADDMDALKAALLTAEKWRRE